VYDNFRLLDYVEKLPYDEWKNILRPLALKHGETIDKGIAEHMRVFGDELPIYPFPDEILRAFQFFDVDATRVVIIGQDCYPSPGNAMGLCFSVPQGTAFPPSLRNVFLELEREFWINRENGDLTDWARQGVLLLNTALTVRCANAGSHLRIWRDFTSDLVDELAKRTRGVCFMLWGAHAMEYKEHVPSDREHLVLEHSHPSPLSRKPFPGCGHFGKANAFLQSTGRQPIDWMATASFPRALIPPST
jgi:uracil-DNA glycosylase